MKILTQVLEAYRNIAKEAAEKNPKRRYQAEPAIKYFELLQEDMAQQKPVLWSWLCIPPELYRGLHVTAICPEVLVLLLSSLPGRDLSAYLDVEDLPPEFCTINRLVLGLAQSGDFALPDMMVYATKNPCDAGATSYSSVAYSYNRPAYFLDVPYARDIRSMKYVAEELLNMVSFVEGQSGRKMDWDKVRQAIAYSNQAMGYLRQLLDLRKMVPCPLASRDLMVTRAAFLSLLGTPELTDWMARRYQSALETVRKGEREAPQEERVRLVWVGNPPNSNPGFLDWLENEYGAVVVSMIQTEYNTDAIDNCGDVSRILDGLAVKALEFPMARHGRMSTDYNIGEAVRLAKEYKADAAILPSHTGCKWNWTSAYMVREKVQDASGIPVLNFEFDSIDKRFLSPEGMQAKFHEFFQIRLGMKPVGQPATSGR